MPFYRLYGATQDLVFHENKDPGTHNYKLDNRQQFYRFLNRHWLAPAERVDDEIASTDEVRKPEELNSPLPEDNATFQSLALRAARDLPARRVPAIGERTAWQRASRDVLKDVLRYEPWEATGRRVRESRDGPYAFRDYTVNVGERWTLPATVIKRTDAETTGVVIVKND